ncbi:MAG: AAA family ATPase [Comamonadaceae bacterium]|nr:AAA family ATPase [Comamonadaceae bacterium]
MNCRRSAPGCASRSRTRSSSARYLDAGRSRTCSDNLELFQAGEEHDERRAGSAASSCCARCRVNVVVDNHGRTGAPVIVDDNPLFRALFGSIEYQSENDVLVTDFSRIRAGSLLQAHGGFLMLHLRDLLADPLVWEKLRRFLRSGRLQIEEPGMSFAPIAAVSLQPEPVDVEVKIVLIGSRRGLLRTCRRATPSSRGASAARSTSPRASSASADTRRATAIFVAHACRQHGPAALLGRGGGAR